MRLGTWDPLLVVLVAFFFEVIVGAVMEALGRRRASEVGRHDPALPTFLLFLKAQFVLPTLALLAAVLINGGLPPDVPADPSALLPEQLAKWMRDEHAAVVHVKDVLGAALIYLALQLWRAFSLTGRVSLGRQIVAAGAVKT